jgi:hypothetical protein
MEEVVREIVSLFPKLIGNLHVKYRAHNPHPATGAGGIAVDEVDAFNL